MRSAHQSEVLLRITELYKLKQAYNTAYHEVDKW